MTAFATSNYPSFQDSFYAMNPDMNITEMNIGGRLIPRSLVSSNSSAARLTSAIEYIVSNNGILAGVSQNLNRTPTSPNSVHPYWRETVFLAFLGTYVPTPVSGHEKVVRTRSISNTHAPIIGHKLRASTPLRLVASESCLFP